MKNWQPVTTAEGVTFTPWTDGYAVGFRVTREGDDRVEYVYLNPSSEHLGTDEDMTGRGDVFVYHSVYAHGSDNNDPGDGASIVYVNVMEEDDDTCDHGLSASLCVDPVNHYPPDTPGQPGYGRY